MQGRRTESPRKIKETKKGKERGRSRSPVRRSRPRRRRFVQGVRVRVRHSRPRLPCGECKRRISGSRYHRNGFNYELCHRCFAKCFKMHHWCAVEFMCQDKPGAGWRCCYVDRGTVAVCPEDSVHLGIKCDVTGRRPIKGFRFSDDGERSLCEEEFSRLGDDQRKNFLRQDEPGDLWYPWDRTPPPMGEWQYPWARPSGCPDAN